MSKNSSITTVVLLFKGATMTNHIMIMQGTASLPGVEEVWGRALENADVAAGRGGSGVLSLCAEAAARCSMPFTSMGDWPCRAP